MGWRPAPRRAAASARSGGGNGVGWHGFGRLACDGRAGRAGPARRGAARVARRVAAGADVAQRLGCARRAGPGGVAAGCGRFRRRDDGGCVRRWRRGGGGGACGAGAADGCAACGWVLGDKGCCSAARRSVAPCRLSAQGVGRGARAPATAPRRASACCVFSRRLPQPWATPARPTTRRPMRALTRSHGAAVLAVWRRAACSCRWWAARAWGRPRWTSGGCATAAWLRSRLEQYAACLGSVLARVVGAVGSPLPCVPVQLRESVADPQPGSSSWCSSRRSPRREQLAAAGGALVA